jgi:hypothetical protein
VEHRAKLDSSLVTDVNLNFARVNFIWSSLLISQSEWDQWTEQHNDTEEEPANGDNNLLSFHAFFAKTGLRSSDFVEFGISQSNGYIVVNQSMLELQGRFVRQVVHRYTQFSTEWNFLLDVVANFLQHAETCDSRTQISRPEVDLHGANEDVKHREEVQNSDQHPFFVISASIGPWIEEADQALESRKLGVFVTMVDDHEENHDMEDDPEDQREVVLSLMWVLVDSVLYLIAVPSPSDQSCQFSESSSQLDDRVSEQILSFQLDIHSFELLEQKWLSVYTRDIVIEFSVDDSVADNHNGVGHDHDGDLTQNLVDFDHGHNGGGVFTQSWQDDHSEYD